MGLTNIYTKYLIVALLLFGLGASAQTTVIPDKLRIKTVPRNPALNDMMVTIDTNGNIKKDTIHTGGGGGSATGVNGNTGTTNIGWGGTFNQNTTETLAGYNFILNQGSTGDILLFYRNSTQVAKINNTGQLFGSGISNNSTGNNAQISTSTTGVYINRNIADTHPVLTLQNYSIANTSDILRVNGSYSPTWLGVGYNGLLTKSSYIQASGAFARGATYTDVLQPTANGDLLVGMDVRPVFGTSIISGYNTLVGGSGYGTGVYNVVLTGGTGAGASATLTATAGAITGIAILNPGVNYTVGDVLGAVVTDSQGNVIGSGFSIRVASITSYTGTQNIALRTYGLDNYDQEYTYTANSKVSKTYVDGRVISNSYSLFASATTTFTVTIGTTMTNNTYRVIVQPTSANAIVGHYVTNKTTTTFDVVFPSGLNGTTTFDWSVMK